MIESLHQWLFADPAPEARVYAALLPALLFAAYFLGGLAVFLVRVAIYGLPRDVETERRGRSLLVGFVLRHYFFWVIRPLWALLLRSGVPATAITTLSVLLGAGAGLAVAADRFALGGWLFLIAGILDAMDGRIARAHNEVSSAGAAMDSVLDRYTDSAILIGLSWHYRETWVLLPALAALVGTALVPYVRARAEGLGVALRGGVMARLERVLFLGIPVAMSPVLDALFFPGDALAMHWAAVAGIVLVGVGSHATAVFRLLMLLRALGAKLTAAASRPLSLQLGMHVLAAAAATGADYGLVLLSIQHAGLSAPEATIVGSVGGGALNYAMNRALTFWSTDRKLPQIGRYALVSGTSALLNAGGVALLALHPALDYRIAWWLVRGAVYVTWNYPLHRDFVFAPRRAPSPPPSALVSGEVRP